MGWLLVEETHCGSGSLSGWSLAFPDSCINNDSLNNELGLGDTSALVQGHGGGERAQKEGSDDVGGLHFGSFVFWLFFFCCGSNVMLRSYRWLI